MIDNQNDRTPTRVPFVSWRMLAPVLAILALLGAIEVFGLPHIRASYDYVSLSARPTVDPLQPRHYTRCDYFGPYGWFRVTPTLKGECAMFEWRRRKPSGSTASTATSEVRRSRFQDTQ